MDLDTTEEGPSPMRSKSRRTSSAAPSSSRRSSMIPVSAPESIAQDGGCEGACNTQRSKSHRRTSSVPPTDLASAVPETVAPETVAVVSPQAADQAETPAQLTNVAEPASSGNVPMQLGSDLRKGSETKKKRQEAASQKHKARMEAIRDQKLGGGKRATMEQGRAKAHNHAGRSKSRRTSSVAPLPTPSTSRGAAVLASTPRPSLKGEATPGRATPVFEFRASQVTAEIKQTKPAASSASKATAEIKQTKPPASSASKVAKSSVGVAEGSAAKHPTMSSAHKTGERTADRLKQQRAAAANEAHKARMDAIRAKKAGGGKMAEMEKGRATAHKKTVRKVKDWDAIHAKNNAKKESIVDHVARKTAEKAKVPPSKATPKGGPSTEVRSFYQAKKSPEPEGVKYVFKAATESSPMIKFGKPALPSAQSKRVIVGGKAVAKDLPAATKRVIVGGKIVEQPVVKSLRGGGTVVPVPLCARN